MALHLLMNNIAGTDLYQQLNAYDGENCIYFCGKGGNYSNGHL